jgi:hypothetical protein
VTGFGRKDIGTGAGKLGAIVTLLLRRFIFQLEARYYFYYISTRVFRIRLRFNYVWLSIWVTISSVFRKYVVLPTRPFIFYWFMIYTLNRSFLSFLFCVSLVLKVKECCTDW